MSHIKYSTKALVIDDFESGESDKSFLILTEDFGLIYASAKSIRSLSSKLRYSLQKLSVLEVVLVRGKTGWKITNTSHFYDLSKSFLDDREKERVFQKIILLVKRFIAGEERNNYLFDIIIETAKALEKNNNGYDLIETLAVLRIMDSLGYIKNPSSLSPFLGGINFDEEMLNSIVPQKSVAIYEINRALEESHL